MKAYDLMQDINVRGSFALSKACVPHLREERKRPHPDALAADHPRYPAGWRRTPATRSPSTA